MRSSTREIGSTPLGEIPNPGSGQPRVRPSGNRAQLAPSDEVLPKTARREAARHRVKRVGRAAWASRNRPATEAEIAAGPRGGTIAE